MRGKRRYEIRFINAAGAPTIWTYHSYNEALEILRDFTVDATLVRIDEVGGYLFAKALAFNVPGRGGRQVIKYTRRAKK